MQGLGKILARAAAGLLAAGLATHAQAATLACGTYREDGELERTLVVRNTEQIQIRADGSAPENALYRVRGKTLAVYDRGNGLASEFKIERGGKRLSAENTRYEQAETAACEPVDLPPPGQCRADLAQCFDQAFNAEPAQLQAWCSEGLSFACKGLIDHYAEQAAEGQRSEPPEPAVCREGPLFDEAACRKAAEAVLAQAVADMAVSMNADPLPLPAERLDELPALCERDGSAEVCNRAAEALWDGGRFLPARAALQRACDRGGDPNACEQAAPLAALAEADFAAVPVKALPCGTYEAAVGLMSEMSFGDRGLVEGTFGSVLRARLEKGQVRMRHDKGGDFMFQPIRGQRLLGVDAWNRFAVHQRTGGASTCKPPVVYQEKPLVQDCPAFGPEQTQACCDRGSAHGCNTLGNRLALSGDWAGAKAQYAKVCEQGVRAGCENLVQVYTQTGDEGVQPMLQKLCKRNPRHVACDVDETTSWAMLGLGQALQQAADKMEQEGEAEQSGQDESGQD